MKKILGILSVLVIIALVIFFPIFPASIEKLSADTILKFHRVGGVAGFMNEVSIDSSGHVYVWGKDTGFLEAQNLNRLTSYISNHTFKDVSNRTSLYNKFIKIKLIYDKRIYTFCA